MLLLLIAWFLDDTRNEVIALREQVATLAPKVKFEFLDEDEHICNLNGACAFGCVGD